MGRSVERMMKSRDHEYEIMRRAFKTLSPDSIIYVTDRAISINDEEVARRDFLSQQMWNEALDLYTQHTKIPVQINCPSVSDTKQNNLIAIPPQFGERLLLLFLSKEERINIPGDLAEELEEIVAKHGGRFGKVWYYKQVIASAWPMIRKTLRWGLFASLGEWIRRSM